MDFILAFTCFKWNSTETTQQVKKSAYPAEQCQTKLQTHSGHRTNSLGKGYAHEICFCHGVDIRGELEDRIEY